MSKYHNNPDNAFYGWNDSWLHADFKNWNITDVIDYIRVPVLAIQGREDQYGTTAQIEALKAQLYAPLETVLLENCQHTPFLEQPDLTLRSITNFCRRLHAIETA
jgi:pimeloyl-ACP methyl ester carboxylesterase